MSDAWLIELLTLTSGEMCSEVSWRVVDGEPKFWVGCSDVFAWGCADAEELTADDLPALKQAQADLLETGDGYLDELADLYVARRRGMRPQGAWYQYAKLTPPVQALFDACGEHRPAQLGNPVATP